MQARCRPEGARKRSPALDTSPVNTRRSSGTIRHILPNTLLAIIAWASLLVCGVNLTESGLSFLGLGVQPPAPSWGSMVDQGNQFYRFGLRTSLFPCAAIHFAILGRLHELPPFHAGGCLAPDIGRPPEPWS